MLQTHRNSQKRFYDETNTYFITTNAKDKFPFFKESLFCELFVECLRLYKIMKQFELYAFVIIPEHLHLLIYPIGDYNISQIMHAIKRHFSRKINIIIGNEGGVGQPRLQGEDKKFLEIIKKHEERIGTIKNKFLQKYSPNQSIFPKFHWQLSFHDHVIRGQTDFDYHYDYIITNSEKHKLVKHYEDYPWSSFNPKFHNFTSLA